MKKKLILPLVLSAAAFLAVSCGAPASSSVAPADSSADASGDSNPAPASSSVEPVYEPAYDRAGLYEEPGSFADVKGVTGGSSAATSLVGESVENKTKILGALEKYAIDNKVTGLPLFENGGYVMYNDRVVKGTENYIVGYGFGIMREGKLTAELKSGEKRNYYHTYEPSDPQKINYLDDSGSQIGDLYGNAAAGYFGTKMNANKNGYDWYGTLSSKNRPVMLDDEGKIAADQDGTSTKWRIYLRTGADGGVKFRTATTNAARAAFNNKDVTIDDYVNAFKILLCGKFAYYRGAELAGQTGYSGIAGAAAYYNASADGFDSDAAKAAWEKVGIKAGKDADGDYIDFTLMAKTNTFYAMYSLASNLYAPINLDFFKLVTDNCAHPEYYGAFNEDKSMSPVDNFLSTGPYMLESWETDKAIAFARNDGWWERVEDPNVYNIPGIYSTILAAINTNPNAAILEFLVGNLDSAGIPTDYLDQLKDDARTTSVPGDSVFKLNLNTCTKDQWVELFGKDGSVTKTSESNYWNVKPWMSNDKFVKGLFYAIDRDTFATKNGSIPSINYFSSNYMSDPLNGISYNTTQAHKDAQKEFWGDTISKYGYSQQLASEAFSGAVDELLASKDIKDGDKLTIDVWWMYQQHITRYHNDIAKYIQDAFNDSASAKAHKLTLEVKGEAVDVWSDVYYKHLMVGQFDLGFGSISGNSLDPLNFMEVLKSDNSSGFTLNWGPDTSKIDLNYNGEMWSFDNLWAAADHGVVTYKGESLPPIVVTFGKSEFDGDGNLAVTFSYQTAKSYMKEKTDDPEAAKLAALDNDLFYCELDAVYITDGYTAELKFGFDDEGKGVAFDDYKGAGYIKEFTFAQGSNSQKGTVTVVLTADALASFADDGAEGVFYFGAYGIAAVDGVVSEGDAYGSVYYYDSSVVNE